MQVRRLEHAGKHTRHMLEGKAKLINHSCFLAISSAMPWTAFKLAIDVDRLTAKALARQVQ